MSELIKIEIDASEGIGFIGSVYGTPSNAIKEPAVNFLDEHINPNNLQRAKEIGVCSVTYTFKSDKIIIEGPYGMNKEQFKAVLKKVLSSGKKYADFFQVGRQAAGLFSWTQTNAGKCVYFSKGAKGEPTIKVTVRKGHGEAEFETAMKSESLKEPGMRLEISQLQTDPTKATSSLHPSKLSKFFGKIFRDFLREGILKIELRCKGKLYPVEPAQITLPLITSDWEPIRVKGDSKRLIRFELYYDPSGKGNVCIRCAKIPVIDNFKELEDSGRGLESSVYSMGNVSGMIDADFLEQTSGKKSFEQNKDWEDFLHEVDMVKSSIEAQVNLMNEAHTEKKFEKVQKEAIERARKLLSSELFSDLKLLVGARKKMESALPPNGFDFMPEAIKIEPGKRDHILFKTYVTGDTIFVPDDGMVNFRIDNSDIEITPKRVTLKAKEADNDGVVFVSVELYSRKVTQEPANLTASHGTCEASARVSFGSKKEKAPSPVVGGTGINYEETPFHDEPEKHSRLIGERTIQINTLHQDYIDVVSKNSKDMIIYFALLIVKETLVVNYPGSDLALEKFFTCCLA
jgi:hypothetical protein